MQKKLIAVAVAGALGAPGLALAQASTVQIYGKAMIEYGYVNQDFRPNFDILQNPGGANIGFKGQEALGGGLSAWFQCESSADTRGDTAAGLCTRNSALGLKGGFGNVYMGKWDTPFKRVMLNGEVGAEDTGLMGVSNITAGFSTGAVSGAASRTLWQRRQHDMISYDTPNFNGFQGFLGYSSSQANAATNGSTSAKPRVMSIAGIYNNGPLNLGLGYEKHTGFGAVGGSNDDYAWDLSGTYTFNGNIRVGGSWNRQNYDLGLGTSSQKTAWHLGAEWHVSGPHTVYASYTKSNDISGNGAAISIAVPPAAGPIGAVQGVPAAGASTGVHSWQVGYQHRFSKRTDAKLGYVKLDNDTNAQYTLGGLVTTGLTPAQAAGASQSAWVMLLRHNF